MLLKKSRVLDSSPKTLNFLAYPIYAMLIAGHNNKTATESASVCETVSSTKITYYLPSYMMLEKKKMHHLHIYNISTDFFLFPILSIQILLAPS